jgi:hypothetical protein
MEWKCVTEIERSTLKRLYEDVDRQVAVHAPRCEISSRCCKFKEYGHTLFLSEMEADFLLEGGLPCLTEAGADVCPYQLNGLCSARERRPLGCRVYFCDPTYDDAQKDISEESIGRLKRFHDTVNRPWRYRPLHEYLEARRVADSFVEVTFPTPCRSGVTPGGGEIT